MPRHERLRRVRYQAVVLSPHFDDAVYSMAGRMLALQESGRPVLVATVFGDGGTGGSMGRFTDYTTRRAEDRAAMAALNLDYLAFDLPEAALRKTPLLEWVRSQQSAVPVQRGALWTTTRDAIASVVRDRLDAGGMLHAPRSIGGHPDHRLVTEGAIDVARSLSLDIALYDDLPYALYPAFVAEAPYVFGGVRRPARWRDVARSARLYRPGPMRALLVPLLLIRSAAMRRLFRRAASDALSETVGIEREADVSAQFARKLDAMRLYATQTPYFYGHAPLPEQHPTTRGAPVERYLEICR
jgi:LmbE family N-acetylglucosaminyl deacetylase